ncbi:MAG: hypothetical protein ACM3P1_07120 [Candidatus Saccharibacteria bacterium]
MKKFLMLCLTLCGCLYAKARENVQRSDGYHQHKGVYLNMNVGPAFVTVKDQLMDLNELYTRDYSGLGVLMDVKAGWSLRENLFLHATLISDKLNNPSTKNLKPGNQEYSRVTGIGDVMVGAGLTYYLMPSNLSFSYSMGLGKYSVSDPRETHTEINAKQGFFMQLKLGKEWWVSKDWGVGVGVTYSKNSVTSEPYHFQSNQLNSQQFGFLVCTTFSGSFVKSTSKNSR